MLLCNSYKNIRSFTSTFIEMNWIAYVGRCSSLSMDSENKVKVRNTNQTQTQQW